VSDRPPADPDDYVDLPPERRTLPRLVVVMGVLAVMLLVVGVGVRGWYQRKIDPPGPPGTPVAVEIEKGATLSGVGGVLADKNVISNATIFRFWARGKDIEVQAGQYRFHEDSSFDEALSVIRKGPAPPPVERVTVPEGLTLRKLTVVLADADARFSGPKVQAALADPSIRSLFQPPDQTSLEGLVFPSTYDVGESDDAAAMVRRMVAQMDIVATKAGVTQGVQSSGDPVPTLSPYEILTVASLIQAEAGSVEEGPTIARVIYNRLDDGMPLGIDATSRFLAEQTGTSIDFESDSPYNTRRQTGLPPTPIGGPGEAAIDAALHPADGNWLYYVLEAPGRHFFTASESEFLDKKQECEAKGLGCG
jgi:UPF0755 protein